MNPTRSPESPQPPGPQAVDAGSQALAEALRSSFAIVRFVMVLLVAVFFASGFRIVGPQEKGIILRLGRPVGEGEAALRGAGLHWSFPYPIDEFIKVPITEIQTLRSTVGWYAVTPEQELAGTEPPVVASTPLNPATDGAVLTADGNIIHSRAILRYRFDDPLRCVFGFTGGTNGAFTLTGVSNAVLNTLNNALLRAAAEFTVDQILTRDVVGFQDAVRRHFERLARERQLGVAVEQCEVQSRPPRQLKQAFDDVINAGQRRSKVLNEALSFANQVTNRAASEAAAILNGAEAQRTRYVETIAADAKRFEGLLTQFQSNPDLYMEQRLVQTMSRVLTNLQDKVYMPERGDGRTRELRLLLNREPPKPKSETSP